MLLALFAVSLFLSAALLMMVQPLAGKVLLPIAGGTPAVWNTCMVFFQAVLLGGYWYAHKLTTSLPIRRQIPVHLVVVVGGLVAYLVLRFQLNPDWIPADQDNPILGLVLYLAAFVGVPFFVLSTTAPILQRWFAYTGHPSAHDPYFLYAASNAGSLLGLLSYPFLIEPNLGVGEQESKWIVGYGILFWLIAICGWCVWGKPTSYAPISVTKEVSDRPPPPTRRLRLLWLALAAIPSSLLMGTTTHLTTDIAPVPLLWVVPLALYLLSFVIVFAWWPDRVRVTVGRFAPMLIVFLVIALLTVATEPILLVGSLHLLAFFVIALMCHGELANLRPSREYLTTFYLTMSAGGVLGGLFNAMLSPVIFANFGLVEYPFMVMLAALVRPSKNGGPEPLQLNPRDAIWIAAFTLVTATLVTVVPQLVTVPTDPGSPDVVAMRLLRAGLMFGIPAILAFALVWKPARFAICLAILLLAGSFDTGSHGEVLLKTRNFFGTLRVTRTADGTFTRLIHGTTQHGQQRTDEPGPPRPLMYYHRNGPVGRLFAKLPPERKQRVAAVGLGCGTMADYANPGEVWTFYEIDPAVVRIAQDPRLFTYLSETRGTVNVVLGDARRQLAREPDNHFDLLVLDAFSSDSIPVHLMTREAFALYVRKLKPNGVLLFHLSNRYLDLPPLVARLGVDHDPPFTLKLDDDQPNDRDRIDGKLASTWAVLYRAPADLGDVDKDPHWQRIPVSPGAVWRDDFSNLLGAWRRDE